MNLKKIPMPFILSAFGVMALLIAFIVWGVPYFFKSSQFEGITSTLGSQTLRARITEIIEEGEIDLGGTLQPYQVFRVELLEGEYKGILMEIDYGKRQVVADELHFSPGDEIYVTMDKRPDGVLVAYYVDFIREKALFWLLTVFVAFILLLGRWKGLRSLLALAFSLLMIIGYVIPHILSGEDPVAVSLIGSGILLGVTLYGTYGWNLKTHASVVSMVLVLLITGALAALFMDLTRLTGYGSEEALFLLQMSNVKISLRGLLLGGMIIGALGVLDDLVITQSSAVFELHGTDESLGFRALFEKAMRIGQDHVAATVNTLVLAYAGASLPLLLMFTLGRGNYDFFINVEFVAEEIVRTLVGSLGLMAAVPLTTAIAVLLALYSHRLGAEWRALLGPETGGGHSHGL
jgi:uncharacterized membrane protein